MFCVRKTYVVVCRLVAEVEDELHDGDQRGHDHAAHQADEHAAHVLQVQLIRRRRAALRLRSGVRAEVKTGHSSAVDEPLSACGQGSGQRSQQVIM